MQCNPETGMSFVQQTSKETLLGCSSMKEMVGQFRQGLDQVEPYIGPREKFELYSKCYRKLLKGFIKG